MPRHTEPSANNALGSLLQGMLPTCQVRTENTQAIVGHPGLRPDVLITASGRAPVVIEAEFAPAANAEAEARERLGLRTTTDGRLIEGAIALRYPAAIPDAENLETELADSRLSYSVFTKDGEGPSRFPTSGWLDGSVEDLADLVRLVSVPQHAVDRAAQVLEEGIDRAEKIIEEVAEQRPYVALEIAGLLGMTNVRQTWRMAGAIVANALIFQDRLTGVHKTVKSLDEVCGEETLNPKHEVLTAWNEVLTINYWPIFAIARDIVRKMQTWDAVRLLRTLRETAQGVNATGVNNAHDLTGRVFQRLIADRKYLATFYTLPASAALLARLAVAKMDGVDWADAEAIGKLRVGDFACGTGALLSAVYEQIAARHERAGGDTAALHSVMMEEVLYGCDVMPSAIHITGSTLAGMQPDGRFEDSRLYTLAYGRQDDGSVAIGSLELLQASETLALFNTSDPAKRTGSVGEETAGQIVADVPDEGFDLVIMNPPFTSNTAKESTHIGTFAPAFAAFDSDDRDQRDMAKRLSMFKAATCYHGHAGMASAFAALGHRKLRPGGVLALVLPLSASAASSWRRLRQMLGRNYVDLTVISLAAAGNDDLSFSSDTGMAECLVIARKLKEDEKSDHRSDFISLTSRPRGFAHASAIFKGIINCEYLRRISDGPYGGTPLLVGNDVDGEMLSLMVSEDGENWGGVRLLDYSLAQTAYALSQSRLWLPAFDSPLDLTISKLSDVASLGRYDLDITGRPPQGPFSRLPPTPTSTYPALWSHNAREETRIVCQPDSQLQVRPGMEAKAAIVWETRSRAHLNRDFRFNSQPLAVAFTDRESIGGRAWPNTQFHVARYEYAFSLWSNSTLGLLCYWWHSNRQVAGRGTMSIRSADSLPVLDFRELSDSQLAIAENVFEDFRDRQLNPAYLADADPNRAALDRYVVCELLQFGQDVYQGLRQLSAKWCEEPSVHGGKDRPSNVTLRV